MTWSPIARWDSHYSVSSEGQVRSNRTGKILRPSPNRKGYLILVVTVEGVRKAASIHTLVAETFLGPRPDGLQVCHGDGDKSHNTVANLRYDTPRNNELDKVAHGGNHNANKTECPQGHAYDEANTMHTKRGRECRTCRRARRHPAALSRAA
jgi:hypothetical protein